MQLAAQFIRLSKFAVIGVAVSLAACSSGPAVKRTTSAPVSSASQSIPVTQIEASPQDLLSEAQAVWQHGADPGQRDTLLLDAAAALLQQGDIPSAQQILVSLAPATLTGPLQARAYALIAQSYLDQDDIDPPALIASLRPLSEDRETRHLQLSVLAQLYPMQQQWLEAASALAQVMEPGADSVNQVWQWINKVPDNKLAAATGRYPELEPYIALRQILQQYGLQTQSLQRELNQFTQVYRGTPLVENLPASVRQANLLSHGQIAKADRTLDEERSHVEPDQRRHRRRRHPVVGRNSEKREKSVHYASILRPAGGLGFGRSLYRKPGDGETVMLNRFAGPGSFRYCWANRFGPRRKR